MSLLQPRDDPAPRWPAARICVCGRGCAPCEECGQPAELHDRSTGTCEPLGNAERILAAFLARRPSPEATMTPLTDHEAAVISRLITELEDAAVEIGGVLGKGDPTVAAMIDFRDFLRGLRDAQFWCCTDDPETVAQRFREWRSGASDATVAAPVPDTGTGERS